MPKISVIIPTYNQEQYITDAIESVLQQTEQDFEIIIVNDASSDQTIHCVQAQTDPRIRLFSLAQNQGESAATNFGIQKSQGKWIAILHSDDIFHPQKLEKQAAVLEQNPSIGAVLSDVQVIDEKGQPVPIGKHPLQRVFTQQNRSRFQWLNYFFYQDNCLCQTSTLIRRQCYEKIGLYDLRFRQIPDFDFWVRFCLNHELYILPEALVRYRVHDANISQIKPETLIRHNLELTQILKHYRSSAVYQNFNSIFLDFPYQHSVQSDPSLAEFALAIQALKTKRSPHQAFGIDVLYQIFNHPHKAQKIQQSCNFSWTDLKRITGELDIFKIVSSQTLKSQVLQAQSQLKLLENKPVSIQSHSSLHSFDSNQTHPLVSLLIPTYNGAPFITETLQSALSQTYPNLEIIISDDGSRDNTLEILQKIQRDSELRLGIFSHPNYGLVGNFNFCLKQARGKYIKFLCQDDLLEPNCIEEMVKLAEQDSNIGLVFSPRRVIIASGSETNPFCQAAYQGTKDLHQQWSKLQSIQSGKELLFDPNCLQGSINKIGEPTTVLLGKNAINQIGGFDESLHQLLDVDLWFRILGNSNVGYIDSPLSCLRIHSGQQTQKNISKGQNLKDYQRFYKKMLFHPDYEFLNLEFKRQVLHKLLAKSQSYLTVLPDLIQQYQQTPNEMGTHLLCYLRQLIAKHWMKLPNEKLEQAYAGELGKAHQLLQKSHLQTEPLTALDKQLIDSIQKQLNIKSLLVIMLFKLPHKIPLSYQNIAIPEYLSHDFIAFLNSSHFNDL